MIFFYLYDFGHARPYKHNLNYPQGQFHGHLKRSSHFLPFFALNLTMCWPELMFAPIPYLKHLMN